MCRVIPTGVSMVVSGGAVSPENRSNEAREIAEQYLYDGDGDRPLNAGYYALLDVADSVAALESDLVGALARIAAVEAERDALAVIIANEAQTLRAYHVGPFAADNPVDAAHLADHLDTELLAALAASPTPTGPERCEHDDTEPHPILATAWGRVTSCPGPATPTGATEPAKESAPDLMAALRASVEAAKARRLAAATPEPTKETP